jgi:hypothetical protein
MGPSRFSPEPLVLKELFARAGVGQGAAARRDAERISFAEPEPPRPAARVERSRVAAPAPAEPEPEPAPADLPPLAEMTDETLGAQVFGEAVASATVEERFERFLQWLMGGTGAFAAFVADAEGLPLVNRNAPDSYVAAIGPLDRAQAAIHAFVPSPEAGSATFELEHENVLQVVWADTSAGRLAVGLVLAGPLERVMVTRIRRITQLAVLTRGAH